MPRRRDPNYKTGHLCRFCGETGARQSGGLPAAPVWCPGARYCAWSASTAVSTSKLFWPSLLAALPQPAY